MVPGWDDFAKLFEKFFTFFPRVNNKQWKKEQVCQFFVVVQLIHRLTKADISCTTTAHMFFFPLLAQVDFECKVVPKIFDNAIQTGFKNALK